MEIIITGATGFLGSHLTKQLVRQGHHVWIVVRTISSLERLGEYAQKVQVLMVEPQQAQPLLPTALTGCDLLIHLATHYGSNQKSVVQLNQINVEFSLRLLEEAVEQGITYFLYADTSLEPFTSGYALTKRHFANWGQYYALQDKINFIDVKLEYMLGPNDVGHKITSQIIQACVKQVASINLSAGEQRRDFIFIEDVLSAFVCILDKLRTFSGFEVVPLGSGSSMTIRQFAELTKAITHARTQLNFGAVAYRAAETMHSQADLGLLNSLGWCPHYSVEEAIRAIVASEVQV